MVVSWSKVGGETELEHLRKKQSSLLTEINNIHKLIDFYIHYQKNLPEPDEETIHTLVHIKRRVNRLCEHKN